MLLLLLINSAIIAICVLPIVAYRYLAYNEPTKKSTAKNVSMIWWLTVQVLLWILMIVIPIQASNLDFAYFISTILVAVTSRLVFHILNHGYKSSENGNTVFFTHTCSQCGKVTTYFTKKESCKQEFSVTCSKCNSKDIIKPNK